MKKTLIVVLAVLGFFVLGGIITGASLLSGWKTTVSLEEQVNAQYVSNKSNYDNMWKKFVEMTQVTELQAKQYKDVYSGLISGRYQDPNLLFKMVKEDNPKLDGSVYVELQREISAGRAQFDNNQKEIADMIREYNTYVRQHFIMSTIFNKKPMDPNKFIVTSERTQGAFDSGKDDAVNLNGDSK